MQDLRLALRSLRKSPGFAITAILTLALGIGVNAAIFQLIDAVRLRSLPVAEPQTLVSVQIKGGNHTVGIRRTPATLSLALFERIRKQQQGLSGIFAWFNQDLRLGQGAQQRRAQGIWVSGDTFTTLGVVPFKGRLLSGEDDHPGCGTAGAVLSYGFWQSEFAGQDSAIGSKLLVDDHLTEVIGVTPPDFFGIEVGRSFNLALPFCSYPAYQPEDIYFARRDFLSFSVMGRLKPGWSAERASAELESISPGIFEATLPDGYNATVLADYRRFQLAAYLAPNGTSTLREKYDASLSLLLGITGLVLLIACANLANLLLARASTQRKGYGRARGFGGVALAFDAPVTRGRICARCRRRALGLGHRQRLQPGHLVAAAFPGPFITAAIWALDWRVLGFTGIVALGTCILFDLVPALRSSRAVPIAALKAGSSRNNVGAGAFFLPARIWWSRKSAFRWFSWSARSCSCAAFGI